MILFLSLLFQTSWDEGRSPGHEGCQTVNVVVFCELDLDQLQIEHLLTSNEEAKRRWAVIAHKWVGVEEVLTPGRFDKYVSLNVIAAKEKGLL